MVSRIQGRWAWRSCCGLKKLEGSERDGDAMEILWEEVARGVRATRSLNQEEGDLSRTNSKSGISVECGDCSRLVEC